MTVINDDPVYTFDAAILRRPSESVVHGLTTQSGEPPDYQRICAEHEAYEQALRAAGVHTYVLPPLEAFPDSMFVEDPALVFGDTAVELRPGAPTRRGEGRAIAPSLREHFDRIVELPGKGYADGGDVLFTSNEVMIGLSARTDQAGAEALVSCLGQLGIVGRIVETPRNVLHFKSDCSLLDDRTVLATERLARSGVFHDLETLLVPDDELAAANALRINDSVLVGASYPKTISMLREAGYGVVPLPTDEIVKLDAGLSCMSLRWRQPKGHD